MSFDALRLGIALSGGGIRAAGFHLGVLSRLAAEGLLEKVTFISTVSGGTLLIGLVYMASGWAWPDSALFQTRALPAARALFETKNIQKDFLLRTLRQPWLLHQGRAKLLARSLEELWGIKGNLQDIPDEPRWVINATTYETGRNWRFMPKRMGDYSTGYVDRPSFRLADAMAASAAVPGLVGPLIIDTGSYSWSRFVSSALAPAAPPPFNRIHLWDGGVYDNLGVEALFKIEGTSAYRDEYNFLIVSDGSSPLADKAVSLVGTPFRLIDVATSQIRALRSRSLVAHFQSTPNVGSYLRLGNTAEYIARSAQRALPTVDTLSPDTVNRLRRMKTHLNRISPAETTELCRHGWEVADYTLSCYSPDYFEHMPWQVDSLP